MIIYRLLTCLVFMIEAIVLASRDLPVPGGPCNIRPVTCDNPSSDINLAGSAKNENI